VKDSSAPQAPNPEVTIPLQGSENRKTFDYQLGQMRTGTDGPTGTTSWEKTPVFNQSAYDEAMQGYNPGSQGTWVPESYGGRDGSGEGGNPIIIPGHWEGATGPTGTMPNRDDFTSYNWTQKTQLSPEQQAIFDATQKSQLGTADLLGDLTKQTGDSLSQPMDWGGIPDLQSGLGADQNLESILSGYRGQMDNLDPMQFNQQMSDAMYSQQTRYLDEQRGRDKKAMEARLADQGWIPGTPGYDLEMDRWDESGERAYGDARDRSIISGTNAGSQAFGNELQALQAAMSGALTGSNSLFSQRQQAQGAGNQARTQAIAELLQRRNQPVNELNAIRSGQQINMPQGSGTSQTPNMMPTDIMTPYDNQYQAGLSSANAGQASNNALMGSAISALAMYF
jgi:hypothetical protein